MGMLISNEPDFMIHGVLKYQLFGQDFWITTTTIGLWIITALILILAVLANRTLKRQRTSRERFRMCWRWPMRHCRA